MFHEFPEIVQKCPIYYVIDLTLHLAVACSPNPHPYLPPLPLYHISQKFGGRYSPRIGHLGMDNIPQLGTAADLEMRAARIADPSLGAYSPSGSQLRAHSVHKI